MNKQENKNIEELANELAFIFVNKCNKDGIKYETIAEDLYKAGYRKQVGKEQADRESIEKHIAFLQEAYEKNPIHNAWCLEEANRLNKQLEE